MACNIGGGCKVCPAMWIALILFVVMTVQGLFFRAPSPKKTTPENSTISNPQSEVLSETER